MDIKYFIKKLGRIFFIRMGVAVLLIIGTLSTIFLALESFVFDYRKKLTALQWIGVLLMLNVGFLALFLFLKKIYLWVNKVFPDRNRNEDKY